MKKSFENAIENALKIEEMHAEEIPAIDLYMDQIITLVDEKYTAKRRTIDEKLLTKTMINNYSKEGLIKPIKGKKYTKEQILQMLAVFSMKNTLSIQEIKTSLKFAYSDESFDLISAWETALEKKEVQREKLPEILKELCLCENSNEETNTFSTLLTLVSISSTCQRVAQNMIDEIAKKEL